MSAEKLSQIKSLQEQGGEEAIKKLQEIKEEAEVSFEGEVEGAAIKAIEEITGAGKDTTESMQAEVQATTNSAENMDGVKQEVKEISEPIQNEANAVVEEGKKEVEEVKNNYTEMAENYKKQEIKEAKESLVEILTNGEFSKRIADFNKQRRVTSRLLSFLHK